MTHSQRRHIRRALLGLIMLSVGMAIWTGLPLSSDLERAMLDYRYATFNRDSRQAEDVVFIDISEQSLKNLAPIYGRWPWPRRVYKDILEFLLQGEPSAILFDVLFSEPQLAGEDDRYFADATESSDIVSHAVQFLGEPADADVEHVPLPVDIGPRFGLKWKSSPPSAKPFPFEFHDFALPNPTLFAKTPRLHVVNVDRDSDGMLRRVPLIVPYDDVWLPSLSLTGVLSLLKNPKVQLSDRRLDIFDGSELKWQVPLGPDHLLPLHFYKPSHAPTTYFMDEVVSSARKIQMGEVDDPSTLSVNPLDLKGKIILVGTSATGLEDLKTTPVSRSYPGALLHISAISNILQRDFLKSAPFMVTLSFGLALMLIAYGAVFFLSSIGLKVLVPLGAMALYIGSSLWLFKSQSFALNMSWPLVAGFAAFLDGFIYVSFIEGRERKRMTGALSKYLSPDVARQMAESGVDPMAEVGAKRELSVLFSDVRGFTSMSEKYEPEVVVTLLNEYLGKMTDVIFEYGGTLDKFIGDSVMAFWGAPVEIPDHALQSVRAALAMRKKLVEINAAWAERGYPEFEVGIGICTGPVIVGNIGSEKRLDYTVIGDNVNLASRLEGLTKLYQVEILIGPTTYDRIRESIRCRPLDLVRVQGKMDAVRVYEPMVDLGAEGIEADKRRRLADLFTVAWEAYARGDFEKALAEFTAINEEWSESDGPSRIYAKRCLELIRNRPDVWDGVYIAKMKRFGDPK